MKEEEGQKKGGKAHSPQDDFGDSWWGVLFFFLLFFFLCFLPNEIPDTQQNHKKHLIINKFSFIVYQGELLDQKLLTEVCEISNDPDENERALFFIYS